MLRIIRLLEFWRRHYEHHRILKMTSFSVYRLSIIFSKYVRLGVVVATAERHWWTTNCVWTSRPKCDSRVNFFFLIKLLFLLRSLPCTFYRVCNIIQNTEYHTHRETRKKHTAVPTTISAAPCCVPWCYAFSLEHVALLSWSTELLAFAGCSCAPSFMCHIWRFFILCCVLDEQA